MQGSGRCVRAVITSSQNLVLDRGDDAVKDRVGGECSGFDHSA